MKLLITTFLMFSTSVGCAGTMKSSKTNRKVAQTNSTSAATLNAYNCNYGYRLNNTPYGHWEEVFANSMDVALSIFSSSLKSTFYTHGGYLSKEGDTFLFKGRDGNQEAVVGISCQLK